MKKQSGFTLLEVLVTVAIIGIIAAIAVPNFFGWLPKYRLKKDTRDLFSDIQYARLQAIKLKEPVVINFVLASNSYDVFVDNGAGNNRGNLIQDAGERTIRSGATSPRIKIHSASFDPGVAPNAIGFGTNGITVDERTGFIELRLLDREHQAMALANRIQIRITGNARVQSSSDYANTFHD